MFYYVKLDENNIVISTISSSEALEEDGLMEANENVVIGMKWNGTSFEEVPQEEIEVEQEPTLKEIYEAIKATEATNDEILYNMLFASNEDVDK